MTINSAPVSLVDSIHVPTRVVSPRPRSASTVTSTPRQGVMTPMSPRAVQSKNGTVPRGLRASDTAVTVERYLHASHDRKVEVERT